MGLFRIRLRIIVAKTAGVEGVAAGGLQLRLSLVMGTSTVLVAHTLLCFREYLDFRVCLLDFLFCFLEARVRDPPTKGGSESNGIAQPIIDFSDIAGYFCSCSTCRVCGSAVEPSA